MNTNYDDYSNDMGYVLVRKLYLRSEPTLDSEVVTILNQNDELMIISEDSDWCNVYTASGQEGFCKKEFIRII